MTRTISRGRTAMRRVRCSRPIAIALADGIIKSEWTFFDYGCGHGGDVKFLASRKVKASGWDPIYNATSERRPADVVNLGFVLNVIEDPAERLETLRAAWNLTKRVLIVAVRVDRTLDDAAEYGDGVVTDAGTFQKIFSQAEFRDYIEGALERRAHLVAPGVAYLFKDEEAEASYLASRAFTRRLEYRTDLIADFAKNAMARRFVRLAAKLGRLPRPEEFPDYRALAETFGSQQRVERLALRQVDRVAFDGSRAQRREDILTYLAMLRLQGLKTPKFSALPATVQADVKASWKRYEDALREGELFLFCIGRPDFVKDACSKSPVGKLLPTDLYVHRSTEDELPALLRVIVFAARRIVGDLTCDLVKIAVDGRAVGFLRYEDFDSVAHPALLRSVRVYLPKASFEVRDYSTYTSPPILHRKDTLVGASYPLYDTFRRLTAAEESAGLLSLPDIGTRGAWDALLKAHGLAVKGHELIRA